MADPDPPRTTGKRSRGRRILAQTFSSLRIQDFKQWLRLKIDAAGHLTIYAIALDRVPRRWRTTVRAGAETLVADDARATAARLIEKVEVRD